jgi:hypothetical protein
MNPSGRRPRKEVLLLAAVIGIAVVLVVSLVLTGAIPGARSSPHETAGEAISYSAARALADPAASGVAGGPWSLVSAGGIDDNGTVSYSYVWAFPCSPITTPSQFTHFLTSARPLIPNFHGALSSGLAPYWLFEYSNGTDSLGVVVVNDSGIALATLSGVCAGGGAPSPIPDADLINSPTAMAAAAGSNLSFITSHPGLNASFEIVPQLNASGDVADWEWVVSFTTCSPFFQLFGSNTTSYEGLEYNVAVNATSGAVPFPGTHMNETCASYG